MFSSWIYFEYIFHAPKTYWATKCKFNWIYFLQPLLYGAQIKSKLEMKKTHDGVTVQFTGFF